MIANSNNLSSSFIQISESKETRLELLSLGLESNLDLVGLHIGAKAFLNSNINLKPKITSCKG